MSDVFGPLRNVLARCRADGLAVPIWWRDDDAIAGTDALDQLQALAAKVACPVHLAVIPAHVKPSLAQALEGHDTPVLVHGWAHENHSPEGVKKAEFGQARPGALEEVAEGFARLRQMVGARLLPMFVPPWNRIAPEIVQGLGDLGFEAVSTYGPRAEGPLHQINTHVDPIDWRGTRDLVAPDALVAQTVRLLEDRLAGQTDVAEPLGLLTHHLVHTPAIWDFTQAWLLEMQAGGAHIWRHDTEGDWP